MIAIAIYVTEMGSDAEQGLMKAVGVGLVGEVAFIADIKLHSCLRRWNKG